MISLCGLYVVIYTSIYSSKYVLAVGLTTHKAMSLRYKFDKNIKGDSKLLITEARSAFVCFANLFVLSLIVHMYNISK